MQLSTGIDLPPQPRLRETRRHGGHYASFDQRAGDGQIVTFSATPAKRYFRSYPQTGGNVDIAEPT